LTFRFSLFSLTLSLIALAASCLLQLIITCSLGQIDTVMMLGTVWRTYGRLLRRDKTQDAFPAQQLFVLGTSSPS
jgi:hypothetical protein